jgi:hypothetical protein
MRSKLPIPAAMLAALVIAVPAAGQAARRGDAPAEAWSTVNVCDTSLHPNRIGIRGSMPGLARKTRMYMRFRVQFLTLAGEWKTVTSGADSRWLRIATGRRGEYDAGYSFDFKPPATGGAHVLRGVVAFQWRREGRVVQRDRRFTEAGHPGTAGADPPDFSADICEIA